MIDPYLGQRTVMRSFLDAILPPGLNPAPGEDLDHFLDGMGDNLQGVHDFLETLAHVRDPYTTPYLDTLEREYGITPNAQLTTTQRKAILASRMFNRRVASTISTMQKALNDAGFGIGGYGLQVFANDPAVNPGPFMNYTAQVYMGGTTPATPAFMGYYVGATTLAFMGIIGGGGLWVINGDAFVSTPGYIAMANLTTSFMGYTDPAGIKNALMAQYTTITYAPIIIASPTDAWSWPLVFFIAAGATIGGGGITALQMGNVPNNMRTTLIEIICRLKPMHTWAGLFCNFS